MAPKKTWKNVERKVARKFGAERTPLSGGNSGHTRSDSLHERLFIEQKYRAKHSHHTLYEKTKELAKKEGKIPVVITKEKNQRGELVICHIDDLKEIAKELVDSTPTTETLPPTRK